AALFAENHEARRRAQHAAPGFGGSGLRQLPSDFAGLEVDGFEDPHRRFIARRALRTAEVGLTGLPVRLVALGINAAFLERLYVVQTGDRVVGGREPISRAILGGTDFGSSYGWLLVREPDGAAVGRNPAGPGQ